MYQMLPAEALLSQGDVIDDCPVFGLDDSAVPVNLGAGPIRWQARVITLTQACDLAQKKATRVVVAVVHTAQHLVDQGILKSSLIRDQLRRGLVYGWYFLPAAPSPIGLSESIVDLRDLHTVPQAVLEHLISDGKRVCRLITPYREHLAQHFATTYSRIGLPEPYETLP